MFSISITGLKLLFIRLLKKTRIIRYVNFTIKRKYNGFTIRVPFITGMGLTNLVVQPDWFDSLIELFVQDQSNSSFIDVGANIGQTLIKIKTSKPNIRYLGFEPNVNCVFYVKKLIHINQFKNCEIINCALTKLTGVFKLQLSTIDDQRASIISNFRPDYFTQKDIVLGIDFDLFYSNQNTRIIKIDAEGAELDIIRGMKETIIKYNPIIFCEVLDYHNDEAGLYAKSRSKELKNELDSLNYSIIKEPKNNRIIQFTQIDDFTLKQWTSDSLSSNDYMFTPSIRDKEILTKLSLLTHN